jgi:HAD superfamily hydrolase (TIGR01509 family)
MRILLTSSHRPANAGDRAPGILGLERPAGVLLDLDGTLVDTVPSRLTAWNRALAASGMDVDQHQIARRIGMDGRRLAQEVADLAGIRIDGHIAASIDARAGTLFNRLNRHPKPLPGARALLLLLVQRAIPWAIATSSRPEEMAISLRGLALRKQPVVIDASRVKAAKPAPDIFIETSKEIGIEPTRCWVVGDSIWDILAAEAAGMTAIGVTAGSAVTSTELEEARPNAVVDTLDGVSRLLMEFLEDGVPASSS